MNVVGNKFKRLIYAFEFFDKSVYVGLTYNSKERKSEHLNPKRFKKSSVYQYIEKSGLLPHFKELTEYLPKDLAVIKEGEFVEKYKNAGWYILNKYKTGALGGNTLIWTKEKCIEDAKKYNSLKEWISNSSSVYCTASKRGWLNECKVHLNSIYRKWTKEKCIEDAKKYTLRSEWRKNSGGAYRMAYQNNFLEECFEHIK